jgi:uncharacterized protein YbjT (DUF2867 family)
MKHITVFGATGMLGKPVVQELVKAGFTITAMVRDLDKAARALPPEVRLVKGDLTRLADVEIAVQGADGLYISIAPSLAEKENTPFLLERDGLHNILAAAKTAGIKRVVYLSSIVQRYQGTSGFDWWIFRIKQQGVQEVKKFGIPFVIFYPSAFFENFTVGQYISGNRIQLVGKNGARMWFIAAADYGKMVAAAFAKVPALDSREYDVQGPEGMTADEAAQVYRENFKKKKLSILRLPEWAMGMLKSFSPKLNYACHVMQALNHYPETFAGKRTWDELHKPTLTLAHAAKEAGAKV